MKVRYLDGDMKGEVAYLSYPEAQECLKSNPDGLEILDNEPEAASRNPKRAAKGKDARKKRGEPEDAGSELGHDIDLAERANRFHNPSLPRDMSDPEYDGGVSVVNAGFGRGGGPSDAQRVGPSTVHTTHLLSGTGAVEAGLDTPEARAKAKERKEGEAPQEGQLSGRGIGGAAEIGAKEGEKRQAETEKLRDKNR
jgi:hypothetical protein